MVKVGKSWWRLVSPAIQKQTNICVSKQRSWRVKNFYWNHRLGGTFSVFKSWFYCLVGWINLGWKLKGWRQKQYTTEIWLVNAPRKFGINLRANTIHGLINYKKILKKSQTTQWPHFTETSDHSYCWWFRNRANQLRLVVYSIIYRVFYIPGGFLARFLPLISRSRKSVAPFGLPEWLGCRLFWRLFRKWNPKMGGSKLMQIYGSFE